MRGPLIVSLDVWNREGLFKIIDQFPTDEGMTVKIGMELFYGEGPEIVQELLNKGFKIFLDLKLQDIPNTVKMGMMQIGRMGVTYTTVHALGGSEMIAAAKEGLELGSEEAGVPTPKLLAVTELTSITEDALENEQNCKLDMVDQVVSLAKLAKRSGADGVITSPLEVSSLKEQVGDDFLYVTPGIRPANFPKDDQSRTATPKQAAEYGSSALVVGRPIIRAEDPVAAYHKMLEEWNYAN
ncbi:orotidine-5'-phosphate decarboxylase [Lentilactobacillus kefiri]|jgi:orotidine-5'-phosphate decarboxylase|uniref:Orotidine 5'-phosphate decarboxylase n=2 Tax=Lentilactobacillus kefiri TaxID=33962 RepID=A0A8E1RK13_LENKE|nr:orotidine-5'-phosphate decarboxylase [Lentilactobacillus kefiri]KRL72715.1 orotidine 5-phosphate decarboxylase [Lentilactobacillus parakefiri DSM 10551]KRM52702.1 orotidine 5-phosphate decarboxylase [Lentilactobacillus kefiri DSM 20587 = JCM 5818]MCJ2161386.1 orotidine-5'-phosphate decarboxylase [Lentilactobacillus kefiri]MCP9368662.1 orotidine-5'-phosphate decarboxylase [Lentilactobacillus kefiri]MDH5107981.1 orotidine-5'-phosphate decarboxylase [Lentilactobacillus kefiri]